MTRSIKIIFQVRQQQLCLIVIWCTGTWWIATQFLLLELYTKSSSAFAMVSLLHGEVECSEYNGIRRQQSSWINGEGTVWRKCVKRSRKIRQGTKLDINGLNCFDLVDESLVRFMWVTEVLHDLCYHDRIDEKEVLWKCISISTLMVKTTRVLLLWKMLPQMYYSITDGSIFINYLQAQFKNVEQLQ